MHSKNMLVMLKINFKVKFQNYFQDIKCLENFISFKLMGVEKHGHTIFD